MNISKLQPLKIYSARPSRLYYESFEIIIYDCNDTMIIIYGRNENGHYYKVMILALTGSVNYDREVHCKLKHT